ncbi:MAG: peptide chain release factor N(5)-glutamine methyltransferase [Candidatus Brocadiaceae bacterium]|nr:peptide chain release factor N(5)-glutamine methyltransferase [Candidatus Brocadiaceae bacterium]
MFQEDLNKNGWHFTFPSVFYDEEVRAFSSLEYISFPNNHTVKNLVRWADKTLQRYGVDSPRFDAELLLMHILRCRRTDLYLYPEKSLSKTMATRFKKAVQRRAWREPLQYITNHVEFMSLDFYVDERVLIPRPETELLVEAVIHKSQNFSMGREIIIVDIGVGSGNITIALAKALEASRIFAIDSSPDALAVAEINAQRQQVSEKITFLCGNIFQPLNGYEMKSKVDYILSNPPYIAEGEFDSLQKEVRDFEPYNALISGQDGTEMFKCIIADAGRWLKPEGFLMFEIGENQALQVTQMIENTKNFKNVEYIKDCQGIDRIIIAQMEIAGG